MLLFGCLIAFGASIAPRLFLILAWIFGRRWDLVWQGNWIIPLLGIIALPYTTIMYMLVWSPTGLHGFDWMWIFLGVLLDIMKWGQIARNREGIPGQSSAQPAVQTAAVSTAAVSTASASEPVQQEAPASQPVKQEKEAEEADSAPGQSELEKLADLRDKGVITEEEYQAKKDQLEG